MRRSVYTSLSFAMAATAASGLAEQLPPFKRLICFQTTMQPGLIIRPAGLAFADAVIS
jgi:hypothetical protein